MTQILSTEPLCFNDLGLSLRCYLSAGFHHSRWEQWSFCLGVQVNSKRFHCMLQETLSVLIPLTTIFPLETYRKSLNFYRYDLRSPNMA
jgi:hypothetical protein